MKLNLVKANINTIPDASRVYLSILKEPFYFTYHKGVLYVNEDLADLEKIIPTIENLWECTSADPTEASSTAIDTAYDLIADLQGSKAVSQLSSTWHSAATEYSKRKSKEEARTWLETVYEHLTEDQYDASGLLHFRRSVPLKSLPYKIYENTGGKMPMARGDGIHRTTARNARMTADKVGNAQAHNERQKESYVNQDIVPERTPLNVHFKSPTASYTAMFDEMVASGAISTRGLKSDAEKFGELIFDVNSAYFYNHGGYEFAKQFYADAYKAAVEIVGGEQYILSAVMHADERNRGISEKLGEDVYHYHLHVVYIPVVEKEVRWTKRCKDPALVGAVKERIMQVSMSKKWNSKPALDENGEPLLNSKGKPVLKKSYSVLQDDFFNAMRNAGYTDVERGERGSSEEHLTVTQFKVQAEQERLTALEQQTQQKEAEAGALDKEIAKNAKKKVDIERIDKIEAKPVMLSPSRVSLDKSEYETLAAAAKKFYACDRRESKLQKALDAANELIRELKAQITSLKNQISTLTTELAQYKSVRSQLRTAELEKENDRLRSKIRSYESAIERNNLWHIFNPHRNKSRNRDDAR